MIRTREIYSITLGIFDDYDVQPAVVFGNVYVNPDNTQQETDALVLTMCQELLIAARKEYGRKFPRSAAFWAGATHTEEYDDETQPSETE